MFVLFIILRKMKDRSKWVKIGKNCVFRPIHSLLMVRIYTKCVG